MRIRRYLRLRKWTALALAVAALFVAPAALAGVASDGSDRGIASTQIQSPATSVASSSDNGFDWGSTWFITAVTAASSLAVAGSLTAVLRTRGRVATS